MKTFLFEQEYKAVTKRRRGASLGRVFATIVVIQISTVNSEEIRINYIEAYTKNLGHGTQALKWLCELADAYGVRLILKVQPESCCPIPFFKLSEWYIKHGFKRMAVNNEMIRYPHAVSTM